MFKQMCKRHTPATTPATTPVTTHAIQNAATTLLTLKHAKRLPKKGDRVKIKWKLEGSTTLSFYEGKIIEVIKETPVKYMILYGDGTQREDFLKCEHFPELWQFVKT